MYKGRALLNNAEEFQKNLQGITINRIGSSGIINISGYLIRIAEEHLLGDEAQKEFGPYLPLYKQALNLYERYLKDYDLYQAII